MRFFWVCLLLMSGLVCAEVYKVVDKKTGKITYTNAPPDTAGATLVEVKPALVLPPPPAIQMPPRKEVAEAFEFEVSIVQPQSGVVVRLGDEALSVVVAANVSIQDGLQLLYKLGSETLLKTTDTHIELDSLPRGELSLTVELINAEGETLATSDPVQILVMRPLQAKPKLALKRG